MRDWERIFLRLMLFMGEGELLVIFFKLFVLADFFGGGFLIGSDLYLSYVFQVVTIVRMRNLTTLGIRTKAN